MLALNESLEQLHPCSVCGPPTSKISWFNFPHLTYETANGTAKGERLPIATQLYQSNNLDNQQQVLGAVNFASLSILVKNARPKPFCWAKPSCFDFSSLNFLLQGHRLSTGGVALRWLSQSALPCKAFKAETHTSFDCLNSSALQIANAPP